MSQQINLLDLALIPQPELLDARRMALVTGLVALLMLSLFGWARYQQVGIEKKAAQVSRELETVRTSLTEVSSQFAPKQPSESLKQDIVAAAGKLKSHEAVLEALRGEKAGTSAGFSGYMQAFARQRLAGVWLTDFRIEPESSQIALRGRALDPELVPQYIVKLGTEQALQGKTFAALDISQPKPQEATGKETAKPAAAEAAKAAPTQPTYVEFTLESKPADAATNGGKRGQP